MPWMPLEIPGACGLVLVASERGLSRIQFHGGPPVGEKNDDRHPILLEASSQLRHYFAGELRQFDLPLDLNGTAFQLSVWRELLSIPYGETRAYGEVARSIGAPRAVRAVGAANGQNPVPIVVPCHRVIGAGGKLVGFGGGLPLKKMLLGLERDHACERTLFALL